MKNFVSLSSNQMGWVNPESDTMQIVSELVLNVTEANYMFAQDANNNVELRKMPVVDTFRFFATENDIRLMIERLQQELILIEQTNVYVRPE